jgi:hypothetical protein
VAAHAREQVVLDLVLEALEHQRQPSAVQVAARHELLPQVARRLTRSQARHAHVVRREDSDEVKADYR